MTISSHCSSLFFFSAMLYISYARDLDVYIIHILFFKIIFPVPLPPGLAQFRQSADGAADGGAQVDENGAVINDDGSSDGVTVSFILTTYL